MIPEEAKQTFSNSRRQLASDAYELEEVTSFIQHMLHERDMKIMLLEVSNTSWMFNTNHGGDKNVTSLQDSHEEEIPQLCE